MKKEAMIKMVDEELRTIPRGSRGSAQNTLRLYYSLSRAHDLAKKEPTGKDVVLEAAIELVKRAEPEFEPALKEVS